MNLKGIMTQIRPVQTGTGRTMALCRINSHRCKSFDELAELLIANPHDYENTEQEVYGYLDSSRGGDKFGPEFVIKGFGKEPVSDRSVAVAQKPGVQKPELDSTEKVTIAIRIPAQCSTWDH